MVLFRKLHKWIGLAIGLQVAIWMLSGLAMGLLSHDRVEGHHNSVHVSQSPIAPGAGALLEPGAILARLHDGASPLDIQLLSLLDQPVYRVAMSDGVALFSARDGSRLSIDETSARTLARADYAGDGQIVEVSKIQAPTMEVRRHSGPVWRVNFEDKDDTSLYLSAEDGAILERRNASWRLFDVFWMLHIMDYQGREDFNNNFAIFFSLAAAWFAITGLVLFFDSFRFNDFLALVPGGVFLKPARLTVCAPHGEVVARISATAGGRLYDELAKADVILPSSCGGGGTCGLCVVKLDPSAAESAADKALISDEERRLGVRLSCQALAVDNLVVGVPDAVLAAEHRVIELVSGRLLTPHIRELTFDVAGGDFSYAAGSFVHIVIPPHKISYEDSELRESIAEIWLGAKSAPTHSIESETSRAYSLATAAEDHPGRIVLNVRFMPPPPDLALAHAGIGSSYMWSLRPGDKVNIIGPLGDFRVQDSGHDMIVIGGGAGMAPLRAIIRHQLLHVKSRSSIQFWYGARSETELFYVAELNELQARFANFRWHAVLSDPAQFGEWSGAKGFVHTAVERDFLQLIDNPGEFDYYVCGPPPMLAATRRMLADFGVPNSQVRFDDFGI